MDHAPTQEKSVGLIAGGGGLPAMVAGSAREHGYRVIAIALQREPQSLLLSNCHRCYTFGVGQSSKILKTLKEEGVKDVLIIGRVEKRDIFNRFKFDLRAIRLLRRAANRNDTTLMKEIEKEFIKEGLRIMDQAVFIKELSVPEGVLSRRAPSPHEREDLSYGYHMAKEIGRLDVGQTVVVRHRAILAVEAIEGTDEAIKRGCALAGRGAVVVKVSKPGQDLRMDIPVVGPQTIKNMAEGRAAALGLDAGKTLFVDAEESLRMADEAGITVVGLSPTSFSEPKP
jgi:hypothetical protein